MSDRYLHPSLWTRRAKWLRKWLDGNGYTIVNKERAKALRARAWSEERHSDRARDAWSKVYGLEDRIKELEAEIEAHKRVEAALAERAIHGERLER